jgi:hypothetical protein
MLFLPECFSFIGTNQQEVISRTPCAQPHLMWKQSLQSSMGSSYHQQMTAGSMLCPSSEQQTGRQQHPLALHHIMCTNLCRAMS